jgi:thiol-disulfide isomerase/thioredoxin
LKKYGLYIVALFHFSFIIQSGQNHPVPMVNFSQIEKYFHEDQDTIYIINFWATWCGPCRKELPAMESIHRKFADQKVKVLLISLDFPGQLEKGLKQFLKTNDITAQVVLLNDPDSNSWIDKVDPKWTGSLPATLIYKGNTRFFFEKELSFEELNHSIVSLNP